MLRISFNDKFEIWRNSIVSWSTLINFAPTPQESMEKGVFYSEITFSFLHELQFSQIQFRLFQRNNESAKRKLCLRGLTTIKFTQQHNKASFWATAF